MVQAGDSDSDAGPGVEEVDRGSHRVERHPELTESRGRVVLSLQVQPAARRSGVVGRHGESLKIRVAAPAVDGRANDAVIALVAEKFSLALRDVTLVSGASSRRKRVLLGDLSMVDAIRIIDQLLAGSAHP